MPQKKAVYGYNHTDNKTFLHKKRISIMKQEKIHQPFKRKVHVDGKIWTYKIGVSNSVILSPDGRKKYIVAHKAICKKSEPGEYERDWLGKRGVYTVNPALIKGYVEKFLKKMPTPMKKPDNGRMYPEFVISSNAGGMLKDLSSVLKSKTYGVMLRNAGKSKLGVVKVVKDILSLGLKESKEIIDNAPYIIKRNVTVDEARNIKEALTNAGATVEIF